MRISPEVDEAEVIFNLWPCSDLQISGSPIFSTKYIFGYENYTHLVQNMCLYLAN